MRHISFSPPQLCASCAGLTFYALRALPPTLDTIVLAGAATAVALSCVTRQASARWWQRHADRVGLPAYPWTDLPPFAPRLSPRHTRSLRRVLFAAAAFGVVLGALCSTRVRHLEAPPFLGITVGGGELTMQLSAEADARLGVTDEYQLWGRLDRVCGALGCADASAQAFLRDNRLLGVLAGEQVTVRGTLERGDGIVFLRASGTPGSVRRKAGEHPVFEVRRGMVERFARRTAKWPVRVRGVFSALFSGDRSALPAGLEEAMRGAGAAHILALSGMHLGILSGAVYGITRRLLGVTPARLCVCVFAGAYLVFAGPRPSLVRAVIMLWIASLARARDRSINLSVVLSLSFLLHALVLPGDLLSLGFQLSFLSLLGLLLLAPAVYEMLPGRIPRVIKGGLAAGLAAQTATAPLVFATFTAMHPAGIVASILLTPVAVAIIALGVVALAIEGLAPLLLPALAISIEALNRGALAASALPSLYSARAIVAFFGVVPCLLGLYALRYRWRRRRIRRAIDGIQRLYSIR